MGTRRTPVLILDVSAHASGLRVSLLEKAPGTYRTVVPLYHHPVDPVRIRILNRDIYAILNRANRRGDIDRGSHSMLRRSGQRLFDELLPVAVKDSIRSTSADELVVCLDDELVYLPWELLHTGHSFLGLRFDMGRIVRTDRPPIGPPRSVDTNEAIGMLVICDPRDDLMASYYEGVSIRDEMDAHRDQVEVTLKSSEVDVGWVQESIRDYDIVHYAGHADYVARSPHDSGWKLAGSKLTSREILKVAGGQPFPLMVFANACRSGTMTASLLTEKHGEGVYGLANAFLLAGVQHFIGALWDIPDESACHFALAFYRELMKGETVGASVRAARRELVERYGDDSVLWGSYVFYGDPTYSIFRSRAVERPAVPRLLTPLPLPLARIESDATRLERMPREARLRGPLVYATQDGRRTRPLVELMTGVVRPAALVMAAVLVAIAMILLLLMPDDSQRDKFLVESVPATTRLAAAIARPLPVRAAPVVATPGALPPAADLRADMRLVTQRVDGMGGIEEQVVEGDAALSKGDGLQVQIRVSEPAFTYAFLVGTSGEVVRLLPSDRAGVPHFRDDDQWVKLPAGESWYRLDNLRGLCALAVVASPEPVELLDAIEGDLRSIRDRIVRESPLVQVRVRRVPVGDGDGSAVLPVSESVGGVQVDPRRLEREITQRLRQSFDSVSVRSLRVH